MLFPRAFRAARKLLPSDAAAEDVAAETLARAYARWRKLADAPWRAGWVVKVASNLAVDALRKDARLAPADASNEAATAEPDLADRVALSQALKRLPTRQREVLVLRYLGGCSEQEIAETLGIAPGSVKTHASRGLRSLEERLGGSGLPAPFDVDKVATDA